MYVHLSDAFHWWFRARASGFARPVRLMAGLVLWGRAAYELLRGVQGWWELVSISPWWLPLFPVAVPLLSLRAIPILFLIVLIPLILTGTESMTTIAPTLLVSTAFAVSLWMALLLVQNYVYIFLLLL